MEVINTLAMGFRVQVVLTCLPRDSRANQDACHRKMPHEKPLSLQAPTANSCSLVLKRDFNTPKQCYPHYGLSETLWAQDSDVKTQIPLDLLLTSTESSQFSSSQSTQAEAIWVDHDGSADSNSYQKNMGLFWAFFFVLLKLQPEKFWPKTSGILG